MAKALKHTGKVRLILVCEESFYDSDLFEGIFDEVHFFTRKNWLFKLPKAEKIYRRINERFGFGFNRMISIIEKIQPDLIQCFAEPYNHIACILKRTDFPVLMADGADFTGISEGIENLPKHTASLEKYCFEHVKGIVHKGPADVIKYYRDNNFNIFARTFQWYDHTDEDSFKTNDYPRNFNSGIHLVYTGNISQDPSIGYCYFPPLIDILETLNIHFHIYPNPIQYHKSQLYLSLDQTNRYFHFHKPLPLNQLVKEISKFDWGVWIHSEEPSIRTTEIKAQTGIGNKIFTYLEAELPIIVSESRLFGKSIVLDNGIGISIGDSDWPRLKDMLNTINYEEMINNVNHFRSMKSLQRNSHKLLEFYQSIIEL